MATIMLAETSEGLQQMTRKHESRSDALNNKTWLTGFVFLDDGTNKQDIP